jgi:hypothetical protein
VGRVRGRRRRPPPERQGRHARGRELTGLFAIDEERLIIHSAHEQATSSEHFRRLLTLIESTPDFDREVLKAPTGKGAEAIELRNGSRILFKTRTGGGGRGLTGDLVVLDEAMIIPVSTTAALVPTMAARSMTGNPQLWYTGSAVDQQQHEHGIVLARVRERGMRGAPRLMYADWSVPGDDPSQVPEAIASDPAMWAMGNPGMGIRISAEHIGDERGALPPRQFAVERLGVGDWPATGDDGGVIPLTAWRALTDSGSGAVDPVCFAIDMPPDRSTATIAAAGKRPDDLRHIEIVDRRAGTIGWSTAWSSSPAATRTSAWSWTPRAPPHRLSRPQPTTDFEVTQVTANEHAQACGMLYDAATAETPTLRHLGTPELDAAIKGAVKRTPGRRLGLGAKVLERRCLPARRRDARALGQRHAPAAGRAVGGGRVRLWPRRGDEVETKADAVLPESVWEAVLAAGDMGGGGGLERAVGLPAVLAVIRLISHAVALVPLHVVNDDQLRAARTTRGSGGCSSARARRR